MKIAHINNTSGLGTKISKEQERKYGHQTKVFVFSDIVYKQFGGQKYNFNSRFSKFKFFNEIKNFDVWHYHYPYGSLKSSLEKKKNKNNNKILIKHYHGSDLRGKFEDEQCFVSTPDLLKFAPNGIWIPIAIDVDEILKNDKIHKKKNNEDRYKFASSIKLSVSIILILCFQLILRGTVRAVNDTTLMVAFTNVVLFKRPPPPPSTRSPFIVTQYVKKSLYKCLIIAMVRNTNKTTTTKTLAYEMCKVRLSFCSFFSPTSLSNRSCGAFCVASFSHYIYLTISRMIYSVIALTQQDELTF